MIPTITDPLGKHWEQPDPSFIRFRDGEAIITQQDFDRLHNYSASDPSGVYVGKMWRRGYPYCANPERWFLCWYDTHPKPGYVTRKELPLRVIE